MSKLININEFFALKDKCPVVDVRSPDEYKQGHIPYSINIPLFENDERAVVGTLYKKRGQTEAVLAGLNIAGAKMRKLAESGLKTAKNDELIVHCWRGGMRSASVAWLFETCRIKCSVIDGGYKSYRRYIHEYFSLPFRLIIIGGMTGSGKTEILEELSDLSFQVLKLEKIAHHKGSAFGNLGEEPQRTNEQFENELFTALQGFDIKKPIFVEDESRSIGRNIIPPEFFACMSESPLIFIDMNQGLRIKRLVDDYGKFPVAELKNSIEKISDKLGGLNARTAISFLDGGNLANSAEISLKYYDKTYMYGLSHKHNSQKISICTETSDAKVNAGSIITVLHNKGII
jgi:tRNA 2-selenouridine synthase